MATRKMTLTTTTILCLVLRAVSFGSAALGKFTDAERNQTLRPADLDKSENQKLIVTTQLQPPYMLLKQHGNFLAGNERFEGFLADILERLATSIGFEYEIRLSREFGRRSDGMIQEVHKGHADIAAGPIIPPKTSTAAMTAPDPVDFTEPFLSFRVSALIHRTTQSPPGPSPSLRSQQRVISSALQVLSSDFTYGVVQFGSVHRMIANSTDPVVAALWTRISSFWPPGVVSSVQEGVDRARRERYAFLVETPTAEYVASRRPCDLQASDPFLDVVDYAFAVRRTGDQRLRDALSRELRRMKQTDELQSLYLKWWKDECVGISGSSGRRASVPEVQTRRRPEITRAPSLRGLSSSCGSRDYSIVYRSIVVTSIVFLVSGF